MKTYSIDKNTRVYFPVELFPVLLESQRDAGGNVDFDGTISYMVNGWQLQFIVNGINVDGDVYKYWLDKFTEWEQGVGREARVKGFLETINGDFVLHPEEII